MNNLEKLEAACQGMLQHVDPALKRSDREEEALLSAIESMDDELRPVDRIRAVQYFRREMTFLGLGKIGTPDR